MMLQNLFMGLDLLLISVSVGSTSDHLQDSNPVFGPTPLSKANLDRCAFEEGTVSVPVVRQNPVRAGATLLRAAGLQPLFALM